MDGNVLQPVIDVVQSGASKVGATLVLGGMIYFVVVLAVRLTTQGRSSKLLRDSRNLLASAVSTLSMFYLLYLAFVVIEPVTPGVPAVVMGPFMMLAAMIGFILGGAILLLLFLGAGRREVRW